MREKAEEQSFVIPSYSNWSEGLLPGLFSVNGVQKVRFSQGNLQDQEIPQNEVQMLQPALCVTFIHAVILIRG